jgi:hypothetical protein
MGKVDVKVMLSERIYPLSCLLLLTTVISLLAAPSRCEVVELVANGGFENGMNGWSGFSYCNQLPREGAATDYRAYSGRYSLYTLSGTGGEHCYGVGGGATQEIQLNRRSNLTLQFNVYLFGTSQVNAWVDIALIVDFWTTQTKKTIVYYVAWTENIAVYRDYPLPKMTSENVKNILLSDLASDKWNHVKRDIDADLKQTYPNITVASVERVSITLLAVTFQRLTSVPMGAFWDDVSITYEPVSEPTSTPMPSLTPTPTTNSTPTATPEPTSTPTSKPHYGCVIATAAYGSELAPEIAYMQHVRDGMIGSNEVGRLLVNGWNTFYYLWSPPIAEFIHAHDVTKPLFRVLLLPLVGTIHLTAYTYTMSSPINSTFASVAAFLFAAVSSTTIYAVMPLLTLRAAYKRRLNHISKRNELY